MKKATIGERVDALIAYKRSLGYVYDTQERYLKHYQRYIEEKYPHLDLPDKASTDCFLDKYKGKPGDLYNAMAPLREFARYLFQLGYRDAYLIPPKQMPKLYPEPPYFFSEKELSAFFRECDSYFVDNPGPRARGIIMPTLFRVLYCCGLRPKEARMLPTKNVHLDKKYIDILQSKGPKSRRIYISDELTVYLICYDSRVSAVFPGRKYFFPRDMEKPYSVQALCYNFGIIWKKTFPGWEGNLPRIYDFRHHFAWTTINRWAREGIDVNAMIPYLMRYMGHNCIKHTLYYFRFVPDFYADYKTLSSRLNDRIPEVPMSKKDTALFWVTAHRYLDHHLKEIRQVSGHTIDSYRDCLNSFINYLEGVERTSRKKISFHNFEKETLKRYQSWMITERILAPKTCNLRMTAIRAFLEYASQEHLWVMPIYTDACSVVGVKTTNPAIEYFEPNEMTALLAAPSGNSKTDRRNQMMLIFLYDTAARVAEARQVKVSDLHLDAEVPYVTLLGKGRKYRNIPLLERTILHARRYLKEFHGSDLKSDAPLFY